MAEQQVSQGFHPEEKNSKDKKGKLLTGENEQESDTKEEIGKLLFIFVLHFT
jgi:hypothetical protein